LIQLIRKLLGKPREPGTTWQEKLSEAAQADGHASLTRRFNACDVLGSAASLFAGTLVKEPDDAASFIRSLHRSPGGETLLSWIAARAARSGARPDRLIAIAETLLDHDFRARGAHFTSQLLTEIMHRFRRSERRRSEEDASLKALWAFFAGPPTAEPDDPSLARVLARFVRAVAANRASRARWSRLEGETNRRARSLVRELFCRVPPRDLSWHRLLVRFLARTLDGQSIWDPLPAGSGVSLAGLCEQVKDTYLAVGDEDGDPVRTRLRDECQAVMQTPGFLSHVDPINGGPGQAKRDGQEGRLPREPCELDGLLAGLLGGKLKRLTAAAGARPPDDDRIAGGEGLGSPPRRRRKRKKGQHRGQRKRKRKNKRRSS
jgi:hypothetical protein